jgi:hypothetical protein
MPSIGIPSGDTAGNPSLVTGRKGSPLSLIGIPSGGVGLSKDRVSGTNGLSGFFLFCSIYLQVIIFK